MISRNLQKKKDMKNKVLFFSLLLLSCLCGCEPLNINRDLQNALTIKPAKGSQVDARLLSKKGTVVVSIGSAFLGGGIPDISEGASHRCHFYHETYPEGYDLGNAEAMVWIDGFYHNGVEYTNPGQQIDVIYILGIDESLGLGTNLIIPMNQGVYEGKNKLIRDVQINSYQLPSDYNAKDSNIDIVITSTAGDVINIHFANKEIPFDGFI